MDSTPTHRIVGCLKGIATGDAIGKQTENLTREDVRRWYPNGLNGFDSAPGAPIPRYRDNRKHQWRFGETTDDTERTLAVANAIIQDGDVTHTSVGRGLLKCRKSVHPGVKSLWEFHNAGDPARIAHGHDGCGAASRVAPVGILYRPDRLEELVAAARKASISTHAGPNALASAAAIAAAVSAAIEGMPVAEIVGLAQQAADMAGTEGPARPAASFAEALIRVLRELRHLQELDPADLATTCFPDQTLTIVPLALALATITGSAHTAILLATNIGGDSDSVASIAGGISGAMNPDSVPSEWSAIVEAVNGHDLVSVAEALTLLRH
jgi:ADP-ribosylglycohydrolase